MYSTDEYKQKTLEVIKGCFDHIRSFTKDLFTLLEEKVILAQGELMSTAMMNNYLLEQGVKSVIIPALDYTPKFTLLRDIYAGMLMEK